MNADEPTPQRSPLFYEILAYFADHPQAQDTVAGIVTWWLLKHNIKRMKTQVNAALAHLVAEELVVARTGVDERLSYRVNRAKLQSIRCILKKKESADKR